MKPVDQTIFGNKKGNCFAACVASLLNLPLEEVPNFCADYTDETWWNAFRSWLHKRKLEAFFFEFGDSFDEAPMHGDFLWIASGKSPRGDFLHSTVYKGKKLEHDPHPSRDGLIGTPKDCVLLIPFEFKDL